MLVGVPSRDVARAAVGFYPGGPPADVGPDCLYAIRVRSEDDPSVTVFMFRSLDQAEESLQALSGG